MSSKTQPSNADDPYRLYFQLPEKRVDLNRLKMICLQLSDGTELWFEKQGVAVTLVKKLAATLRRAETAESCHQSIAKEINKMRKAIADEFKRAERAESRVKELLERLEAAEAESKRYNDALTVAILAKQDAELLASHAHQKTYKDALIENTTAESRIADLEARLELTPESMGHDGIYARDETIRLQDKRIDELEQADRDAKHDIESLYESVNYEMNRADVAEDRVKEQVKD